MNPRRHARISLLLELQGDDLALGKRRSSRGVGALLIGLSGWIPGNLTGLWQLKLIGGAGILASLGVLVWDVPRFLRMRRRNREIGELFERGRAGGG